MPFLIITLFASLISSLATAAISEQLKATELFSAKPITLSTRPASKKGLVVAFMSAKCPCSDSHLPELKKLAADFPEFEFALIHSNADEPVEQAQKYFKSAKLPFAVLQDTDARIADEFKASKTPHVFLINSQGEIVYRGGMTNSSQASQADKHFLREALSEMKQGKKISVSETRTLGCAIARANAKNVW